MRFKIGVVCLGAAISVASGNETRENLLGNGDFENGAAEGLKTADKYISNLTQDGWDLGEGPYAIPKGWIVSGGASKLRIASKKDSPDKVYSRELSLVWENNGKNPSNIYAEGFGAGKHKINFWAKGEGSLAFCLWCYKDKKSIKSVKLITAAPLNNEWREYSAVFDTAEIAPEIETFNCVFSLNPNSKVCLDDVNLVREKKE